jgi:hypothetical protein
MDSIKTAKTLTKVGVAALGTLAIIGILAMFFIFMGANLGHLEHTFAQDLFSFLLFCLAITAGFCLPAAFIISCTNIAEALKEGKRSEN